MRAALLVALLALAVASGCVSPDSDRRLGFHMARDAQLAVAGDGAAASRLVTATATMRAVLGDPDGPVAVEDFAPDVEASKARAAARGRIVAWLRSAAATAGDFATHAILGALGLGGAIAFRGRLVQIASVGLNVLNTIRGGGATWATVRAAVDQGAAAIASDSSGSASSSSKRRSRSSSRGST